jgi:hypothetical protein
VINVLPEDQIPNNTLFLKTIDTKEEAGAIIYKETLIYAKPFLAWRYTNLVCSYDMSIQHIHSICEARTRPVTLKACGREERGLALTGKEKAILEDNL